MDLGLDSEMDAEQEVDAGSRKRILGVESGYRE